MSTTTSDGPCLGGIAVTTLLQGHRARLVEEIVGAIIAAVPLYGDLPAEVLQVDVRRVAHENLRTFADGLLGGGLDEATLGELARSAYRRAEEGVPLQLVEHAYLVGARTAWQTVTSHAAAGDEATLRSLGADLLSHLAEVFSVVSAAYLEELRSEVGEEHSRRSRMLRALLAGEHVEETARSLEIDLAPEHVVVALWVGAPEGAERVHAAESTEVVTGSEDAEGEGPGRQIARRRTLRALRVALLVDHADALAQLDAGGGVLVLPRTTRRPLPDAEVDRLVVRLAEATRAAVHAGVAVAPTELVREAAHEASEVLALARRSGRRPGAHRMRDVLVDYQLTRPGPGAQALRSTMAPLVGQDALLDTLRVHLEEELSRAATAARLHVHANTVDYRLGRVRALTGLDPSVASQLVLLRAGLAVLDLTDRKPGRS